LIRFLPSTFTISAFCFGLTSVRFSLFHKWEHAVTCVLVAALLDALDGKVARLLGQSSRFGAELDSLSDLVCFGVAPSIVLFLMSAQAYGRVGWSACMFYTIC
jgi:CDP-diacylglycerol--serine O-phosphatidyltransferase